MLFFTDSVLCGISALALGTNAPRTLRAEAFEYERADGVSPFGSTTKVAPEKAILVGDLNIAPREDDVWNHKQLLKIVSHTPIEVEHLGAAQDAGNWVDITRKDIPEGQLYSWWSYRARDWDTADKGRRLDHVWATPDIAGAGHSSRILRAARGWEKPSDHAPVLATFDL